MRLYGPSARTQNNGASACVGAPAFRRCSRYVSRRTHRLSLSARDGPCGLPARMCSTACHDRNREVEADGFADPEPVYRGPVRGSHTCADAAAGKRAAAVMSARISCSE